MSTSETKKMITDEDTEEYNYEEPKDATTTTTQEEESSDDASSEYDSEEDEVVTCSHCDDRIWIHHLDHYVECVECNRTFCKETCAPLHMVMRYNRCNVCMDLIVSFWSRNWRSTCTSVSDSAEY